MLPNLLERGPKPKAVEKNIASIALAVGVGSNLLVLGVIDELSAETRQYKVSCPKFSLIHSHNILFYAKKLLESPGHE